MAVDIAVAVVAQTLEKHIWQTVTRHTNKMLKRCLWRVIAILKL